MSARDVSLIHSVLAGETDADRRYHVPEWMKRLTPKQGWDTYLLLLATVSVVGLTVQDGRWVRTPGLALIIFASTVTGLLLAKVRVVWPLLHMVGLGLGSALVVWQGSSLAEGDSIPDRMDEMWTRLDLFYEAATTGGISTDLLPFSLVMLASTWLLGYFASWSLFRSTNVWVGLVLAGMAMLTALSFLPDRYVVNFFAFIFLAMMLVARVTMMQRQEQWRLARVGTFSINRWLVVRATVVFSVAVLLVAAVVPLNHYRSRAASEFWGFARTPIAFMEDDFSRLLSAIPSRENEMGRFFGTSLPFLGKIKLGGEVAFWTDSEQSTYWLSRTYSRYTPQGWFAGDSEKLRIGPDSPPPRQESLKRELVFQSLQPTFDTKGLLSGGNMDWVSREASIETLAPMRFQIEMQKPERDGEFPEQVQRIAAELRESFSLPVGTFVESTITGMLPPDLILDGVSYTADGSKTYVERVFLLRMEPTAPDVVSWRFIEQLDANDTYEMNSFVSKATAEDLRTAGANYSGFIRDHYLQLPAALPERVRNLASEVTLEAETPLDKALAIRDYLRGDALTYSQDIKKPPRGADGVDYFLFEAKEGYSDYFSSAMAVMLRAVGVPARLAAGYASGEPEERTGRRAVKDSDSHGWTQVYFPDYGWIDFEPTPIWPESKQFAPGASESASTADQRDARRDGFDCPPPDDLTGEPSVRADHFLPRPQTGQMAQLASFQEADPCDDLGPLAEETSLSPDDSPSSGASRLLELAAPVGIALGAIAAIALATWFAWTWGLGDAPGERAYAKMSRLGTLAGIRPRSNQTPIEYARTLGQAIPRIYAGSQVLAWTFAIGRYGRQGPGDDGLDDVKDAWKSMRAWLMLRALRRLVPIRSS